MPRLHSCIRPSTNTRPSFTERNANQNSHEIVLSPPPPPKKITKLRTVKGNEKSPWRGSHEFANHPEEETKCQT